MCKLCISKSLGYLPTSLSQIPCLLLDIIALYGEENGHHWKLFFVRRASSLFAVPIGLAPVKCSSLIQSPMIRSNEKTWDSQTQLKAASRQSEVLGNFMVSRNPEDT